MPSSPEGAAGEVIRMALMQLSRDFCNEPKWRIADMGSASGVREQREGGFGEGGRRCRERAGPGSW